MFLEELGEALLQDKDLRRRISIKRLLEEFVEGGREIVDSWDPDYSGGAYYLDLSESNSFCKHGECQYKYRYIQYHKHRYTKPVLN